MKVAQYEVLGNSAKGDVRPARDDRNVLAPDPPVCGFTSVSNRSIVPPGTGRFFGTPPSTSCWATFIESPPGRIFCAYFYALCMARIRESGTATVSPAERPTSYFPSDTPS
jgi:hypothetical protein